MSRNTMMIFAVCAFCMFASLTTLSQSCSKGIDIVSNTIIILNAEDLVNGTNLTFTGIIHETPGTPEKNYVPNATLNMTWNGTPINTTISDSNGYFNFSFPVDERAGDYVLNVSFGGDDNHNASYNEALVRVKHPVVLGITISDSVVIVGNNVTVDGFIMDDDNNSLDSENLLLKMDGTEIGNAVSLNGDFSFKYPLPLDTTPGNHTLTVEHPDSAYYLHDYASKNISVKRTTHIVIGPKTVGRNISAETNGTLLDNTDEPVAEAEVNIFWNKTYLNTTKTDESGVFSFEYHVDSSHPLGEVEVNASFNGSDFYTSSENTTNYTVTRGVIILLKPKNVFRNSAIEVEGSIVNDQGAGVENLMINITFEGNYNITYSNDSGFFSATYYVSANHSLGNVGVTVKFSGNDTYAPSEKTVNYTVMARTNITISAKILRRGEFVDINGTLFDDMGNGVTGDVEIFWDNTFLGMAVSGDDGNFSFGYPVAYDNPLGPVRVDVVFNASGFYGESNKSVFYNIVSNTTIIMESKNVFRNTTIEIEGRIVDDQGAGIWNLTINVTLEDNYNITKSNDSGFFSVTYYIPANHFLGNLTVNTSFKGSDFYLSSSISINYSVVSNTTITMPSKTVFKGSSAEITGSVVDDNGTNVKGLLNIYLDDELIGNATSNETGFTFYYQITQNVGNVSVKAVFLHNDFYLPSENTVNYTIIANTTLTFSVTELIRGESFAITGQIFENCSGQRGAPVPKHQISILLNDLLIGCVFTGINGSFMLTDTVPAVSSLGKGTVNVTFKGSLYLKPSNASANVTVKERIKITINAPSSVLENEEFECEIILSEKIFNLTISVELTPLCDEGQTQVDSMFYNILPENGLYCFNLTTDKDGKASFLVSAKFVGAMSINASFQGKEHFTGAASNKTVLILRKQAGEKPAWMYFLIIPILCLPGLGYYILRKRHLSKMRKIIVDARGELIAGSEYIRTILKLYKRLCDHLKKHGLIRKKFETFREFENAIKKTLPVDREHLNKFIALIEEVRYSSHDIGSRHRDEAIQNFTAVENSLKNILGREHEK